MSTDLQQNMSIGQHTSTQLIAAGENWSQRYWCIFTGQAASLIGSSLTQFVLLWWITDMTKSVSALAIAGVVALVPQALLSPLGGVLADRYSRRKLIIISDSISALCMLVLITLFLNNLVELWHVYSMMFIRSAMQALQQPAAAASLAMLVPENFMPRAVGLNQTLLGIMLVASAPLGALAMTTMPMAYVLAIDVFTAILGILPLCWYAIPQPRSHRTDGSSMWRELREGCQVVWDSPVLRRLYGLVAVVTLLVMPSFTLIPLLVSVHFGGGVSEVALLEGLAGAGMILGGLLAAIIAPQRKIYWILPSFALACFLLGTVGMMPGNQISIAAVCWALSSLLYILGNAPLTTLLQSTVPNQLQGRVLALLTTVMALAAPLGLAVATPLGELIGIRWLFVVMGVLGGMVALSGLASPVLRQAARTN